ncbi:hypothetical protein L4F92_03095 [Avibacterium sp. 21-595]|uniref:hypothetical protein n=1 Tax=unclassified Avibacterium TaxID=2685287 RepID=UPI0020265F0D|nr:hypothetical protein [Avibacterium sp. 21-595]URL02445.1 hypothetical protein L4F91_02240 [Avibacterium sp. 20-126]URL07112.1 hypothetical protein L4F92_03095 [Avibacterium sp. 21-595]
MKLKDLINPPENESYLKNSSKLITALFIIGGITYYPTKGYGTVIALVIALMILVGQKLLLSQINKDFADMYFAKEQFEKLGNKTYLEFIVARSSQILQDNKVLSEKGKRELQALQQYATSTLAK